jgi:hypothetical protein
MNRLYETAQIDRLLQVSESVELVIDGDDELRFSREADVQAQPKRPSQISSSRPARADNDMDVRVIRRHRIPHVP